MNQDKLFKLVGGGVLLLVVVALFVIFLADREEGGTEREARVLQAGDSVRIPTPAEREALVHRLDTAFPEGRVIRAENTAVIFGRGAYRDWGVRAAVDFAIAPEFNATAEIEANDGTTLVGRMTLNRSRYSEFHFNNPDIRLDLGARAHAAVDGATILIASLFDGGTTAPFIRPGVSRMGELGINQLLRDERVRRVVRGPLEGVARGKVDVSVLEGAALRVTYVNGIGVTNIEILESGSGYDPAEYAVTEADLTSLAPRINNFFALFSRLVPDESARVGAEWAVSAVHLPNAWPALGETRVSAASGELLLRRVESAPDDRFQTMRIEIPSGQPGYRMHFTHGRTTGQVLLQPEGHFLFDTGSRTVSELVMESNLEASQRSRAYWLFEVDHEIDPRIVISYRASVDDSQTTAHAQ